MEINLIHFLQESDITETSLFVCVKCLCRFLNPWNSVLFVCFFSGTSAAYPPLIHQ